MSMTREPAEERGDDGRAGERRPGARRRSGREGLGGAPEGGAGSLEDGQEAGSGAESQVGHRAADLPPPDGSQVDLRYTPLWRAQHEARYLRRQLIQEYQA